MSKHWDSFLSYCIFYCKDVCKYPYPYPYQPVPKAKPVDIRTHGPWVRVWTGTGTDGSKNTHGLPMSNTTGNSTTFVEALGWAATPVSILVLKG